jgi:hypothetical protein
MIKILLSTLLLGLTTFNSIPLTEERLFCIGHINCKLSVVGKEGTLATFVALHENEITAIEAFDRVKKQLDQIKLFELKQSGERLLKYHINGKDYLFDPNRIFSVTGIKNTLNKYNKNFPEELERGVKSFSDSLLRLITPPSKGSYVIALHNNTENEFSILSYKNSVNATSVFVSKKQDIDNFFIVTQKEDFEYFKSLDRSVVLQSPSATDDGSLSVYFQKNGMPYINIEAQHGQLQQQTSMIQEAYALVKRRAKG